MFSKTDFKAQLSEMMKDLKETFATKEVNSSTEGDHIKAKHIITEGGMRALDDKIALIAEYGFDVDSLGFSIEDISVENLRAELEKLKAAKDAPQAEDKFALTSNIIAELEKAIGEEKIAGEWWDEDRRRYQYVDSDFDLCEVYCWDAVDWLLYGFTYAVTGDSVVVDFTSRKRKKWAVADFNDGEEQASPFGNVFQNMTDKLHELSAKAEGFSAAEAKINSLEEELEALRSFKTDTESNIARSAREAVFSKFEDLAGSEAFEALKTNCESYSADELEEKCYAIRGRNGTASAKFALNNGTPKLKVDKSGDIDEPYGGIFLEFNVKDEMN